MQRPCRTGFALLLLASHATAGVVTFTPDTPVVDPAVTTLTSFLVSIEGDGLESFDGFDLLLEAPELRMIDWAFSPPLEWPPLWCDPGPCPPMDHQFYVPSQILLSWMDLPVEVGRLTVDAAGLAPGEYEVIVNTEYSAVVLRGEAEWLSGTGTVRVVPEPGALSLLALGALAVVRRRTWAERQSG